MKHFLFVVVALLAIPFSGNSQTDDGRASDSKLIEVSKGIYIYQNKGGNIGLSIGNDGIFMIDDQFADVSKDLLKDIRRISKKPLKFVVNTHHHGDHTGGNMNMVEEGAMLFSHDNVRKRLEERLANASDKSIDERILPVVTIKDDLTFHFNGEEIMVFHIHNAHTDGDVMVYFTNSDVMHTGDAYIKGAYPFIDYASGGSYQGYMEGLETLLMMIEKDTKIIPGHGDVAGYNDVRELGSMMNFVWKRVAFHHLNGKTEAQILLMRDITAKWDEMGFGDGFISREKFLKAVYKEIAVKYDQSDFKDTQDKIERMKKEQAAKDNDGGL